MPKVNQRVGLLLSHLDGNLNGTAKLLDRFNDMIGRRHEHDGVRIVAGNQGGAETDARSRVAAGRFTDDVVGQQTRELAARSPRE